MELAATIAFLVSVIALGVALIQEARSQISLVTLGLFFLALAFLFLHWGTLVHLVR